MSGHVQGSVVGVTCAFCGGKGRDPFGVMSPLATCQVCGGRGVHLLRPPLVSCAFCHGTGVHPGSRLTCTVCGGVGRVELPEGAMSCPFCRGSGRTGVASWNDSRLSCGRCGGTGFVVRRAARAAQALAAAGGRTHG